MKRDPIAQWVDGKKMPNAFHVVSPQQIELVERKRSTILSIPFILETRLIRCKLISATCRYGAMSAKKGEGTFSEVSA